MKLGLLVVLLFILVLALGVETGYIIKVHQDTKAHQEAPMRFEKAAPMAATPRAYQAPRARGSAFDDDTAWNPFQEMEEMQRVMNRMFRESYSRGLTNKGLSSGLSASRLMSYNPDIDVTENDKEYAVKIDLPGIDKNNITLKVENGQLIISGERKFEQEEKMPGSGSYRSERSFGSFTRTMPVPADADVEKMTAETKNGVMTVTIPKRRDAESSSARKIPIK